MTQRYNFQPYDFTLTPGGSQTILVMGEYFRIQAATGAVTVTVEGYGKLPGLLTGQGLQRVPYSRLILTDASGAANAGVILCSGAEFVDNRTYGVNSLDTATVAQLNLPRPLLAGANFKSVAVLAANTAEQVFAPGANVNGAIIHSCYVTDFMAGQPIVLIAKAGAAPATTTDGEIIAQTEIIYGATFSHSMKFTPARMAVGLGLYFIGNAAGSAGFRSLRYTLL